MWAAIYYITQIIKKILQQDGQSPEYTHNPVKQEAISHGNILGSRTAVQYTSHMFQIFPFYKTYQNYKTINFFSQNLEYVFLLVTHISPEPQESNRRHNNENMREREGECVVVGTDAYRH